MTFVLNCFDAGKDETLPSVGTQSLVPKNVTYHSDFSVFYCLSFVPCNRLWEIFVVSQVVTYSFLAVGVWVVTQRLSTA